MKWISYFGDKGYTAYLNARVDKIWGAKEGRNFEELKIGDILYLFFKIKADLDVKKKGFPRVSRSEEFKGVFRFIVKIEVKTKPIIAKDPFYGDSYPVEFKFEEIVSKENIHSNYLQELIVRIILNSLLTRKIKRANTDWDIDQISI